MCIPTSQKSPRASAATVACSTRYVDMQKTGFKVHADTA